MVKNDLNIKALVSGERVVTKSADETKKLAEKLISKLVRDGEPVVIALTGDLGSGKTTFTKGLANGLRVQSEIISPTFILVRTYEIKLKKRYGLETLYHIDLYRLEGDLKAEVENIGLKDILSDPGNVVVIEWAEKIRKFLPDKVIWIKFEYKGEGEREINLLNGKG